ncbi:MAG: hypothetical protein NT069_06880, partial [Planctomycetota bacterium]|nr:hypothetical protein [Planctomycetota bacterium]
AAGNGKFPWLNVPYIYGMTALGEMEKRPEHLETAIRWVTPLLDKPTGENFSEEEKGNLYYQRGMAFSAKGDQRAAANDFTRATQLAPPVARPSLASRDDTRFARQERRSRSGVQRNDSAFSEFSHRLQ